MPGTIFIQIAAYRDKELKRTIKDCLEKATFPQNLVFSICWQHAPEDEWDNMDEYAGNPQFKIIDIKHKESNGVCWARNLLQQQYAGEDYTLQLDSHHRFVAGWDEYLINTQKMLVAQGYKPLITGYIPGYDPVTDTYINPDEVWKLQFNRFSPEGMLHLNPETEHNVQLKMAPLTARLYSAHFAFAAGDFVKEVPHDPEFYFHGEEPSIAVRAYTHGYDLFHPHKCFVYHFYERKGYKRHWDDVPERHGFLNGRATERFRKLLGVRCEREDLGIYGLGTARTLEQYERYSGIRFKDCRIQHYTLKGYPPPNPHYGVREDYDNSFLAFYKHCIDVNYDKVPAQGKSDYWVVAFLDKDGVDVFRQDAPKQEIHNMLTDADGYCKIWREFFYDREPVKWRVWPHLIAQDDKTDELGFWPRIEGDITPPGEMEKIQSTNISHGAVSKYTRPNGEEFEYDEVYGDLSRTPTNVSLIKNKTDDYGKYCTILRMETICGSLAPGLVAPPGWNECVPYEMWLSDYRVVFLTDYPITDEMSRLGVIAFGNMVLVPRREPIPGVTGDFHATYGNEFVHAVLEGSWVKEMQEHEAKKKKPVVEVALPAVNKEKPSMRELYMQNLKTPYKAGPAIATLEDVEEKIWQDTFAETILVHLPAYREPELIPTILDALGHATNPSRIHFGICRQYNPNDGFDNLDEFRNDPRFKIIDVLYGDAQGLPWARGRINDELLTDETYVLQLDSHHRFVKDWDCIMIAMHNKLEETVEKPILTGYTPLYSPFRDPEERVMVPWMSGFRCFYPFGTMFIGPQELGGWREMTSPARSRFLCGHFDFARAQWARDIRHDPSIYFAGEEINLTVRSFTHGYDFYHPHRIVLWHATMREERDNICKWDDDNRKGIQWDGKQNENRRMLMKLFGAEDHPDIVLNPTYGLGTERTVAQYEKFAGLNFRERKVQKYTEENRYPPVPDILPEELGRWWNSFYYAVNIYKEDFPRNDYKYILVAFDDINGDGINYEERQPEFIHGTIHYVKYFITDRPVHKVVYWAVSKDGEWRERKETIIPPRPKPAIPKNGLTIENAAAEEVEHGRHADPGENSMLIQILDEGYAFPAPKHNFKEVYEFRFCDWTTMRAPYGAAAEHEMIQEDQAEEIAKLLVRAKEEKMNIVVHCLYGRCRSTGVCEAAKEIGFELIPNSKDYVPNTRVAEMVTKKLKNTENATYK